MADLLKCPFCGGEAEVVKAHSNTTEFPYVVVCKNDLCNASVGRFSASREKAIEAWNTRKPEEAVVAELEKQAKQYRRRSEEHKEYDAYNELFSGKALSYEHAIEIVLNGGKE